MKVEKLSKYIVYVEIRGMKGGDSRTCAYYYNEKGPSFRCLLILASPNNTWDDSLFLRTR